MRKESKAGGERERDFLEFGLDLTHTKPVHKVRGGSLHKLCFRSYLYSTWDYPPLALLGLVRRYIRWVAQ